MRGARGLGAAVLDPEAIDGLRKLLSAAELAERLRGVIDTLDAAVDELGTALRIDDVAAVGRAARRLSSSARLVGAFELAEAAGALEVDAGGVPRLTRNARRDQASVATRGLAPVAVRDAERDQAGRGRRAVQRLKAAAPGRADPQRGVSAVRGLADVGRHVLGRGTRRRVGLARLVGAPLLPAPAGDERHALGRHHRSQAGDHAGDESEDERRGQGAGERAEMTEGKNVWPSSTCCWAADAVWMPGPSRVWIGL